MLRGPEEIDPVQKADEQRRIAERRERAADIGGQEDEKHDHMGIVQPRRVGPQQRPTRIMAAPVVPTRLAIRVPSVKMARLTSGVPRSCRSPKCRPPPHRARTTKR